MDFQVFDLGKEAPDVVLRRIYLNLEKLKSNDEFAAKIQEKLRIIVSFLFIYFYFSFQVVFGFLNVKVNVNVIVFVLFFFMC